jgi:hypothetical protein
MATATLTSTPTRTPTAGPTPTPTPTPISGGASWLRIEAESFNTSAAGVSIFNDDGGQVIGNFDSGRWVAFNNINLNGGLLGLRVRGSNSTNGTLRLRAGSATGAILCTLNWTTASGFVTRETSCTPSLTGVQTLVLVNESTQWINVNWIEINRQAVATATPTPAFCVPPGSAQGLAFAEASSSNNCVNGLSAEYFNNRTLTPPAVIFDIIDQPNPFAFNWGTGVPRTGVNADNFSVRWMGFVQAPTAGAYVFSVIADDGVRLLVGGSVLIDQFAVIGGAAEYIAPASIAMQQGEYRAIQLEYTETTNIARVELWWTLPSGVKQQIPLQQLFPTLPPPTATPVLPTPLPTVPPATATTTPAPVLCSIFGCGNTVQPVDWGTNHIGQPNAVDLVPVGVTTGSPLYSISNANWPGVFPATVYALAGGEVVVLMPPPDRTCTGCGDIRIRTPEGICYQYKHVVPAVTSGALITSNTPIGVVIEARFDPAPGVGAGDTSHLHLDRYLCADDSTFTFTGNATGSIRDMIPHLLP